MSYRPADPNPIAPGQRPAGHLPSERLAALADELPSAGETAHLAACRPCAAEREAHRALLAEARQERDRVAPPLTDWTALAGALRGEGLLRDAAPADAGLTIAGGGVAVHAIAGRRRRGGPPWAWRAAAALLLAVGGAAVGRASAGAPVVPPALAAGDDAEARVRALLAERPPSPSSQEEAIAVLRNAERDYRLATQWLAERTAAGAGVDRPEDYQRRLAVMDEVASLTGAALSEAPHDPVLNQYYLASLSAREATLRQLGTVLPAGAQLNGF